MSIGKEARVLGSATLLTGFYEKKDCETIYNEFLQYANGLNEQEKVQEIYNSFLSTDRSNAAEYASFFDFLKDKIDVKIVMYYKIMFIVETPNYYTREMLAEQFSYCKSKNIISKEIAILELEYLMSSNDCDMLRIGEMLQYATTLPATIITPLVMGG